MCRASGRFPRASAAAISREIASGLNGPTALHRPETNDEPLLARCIGHVDPERPDYERYPRFRGVTPLGGVVNPGEAVFIPHGWWHHTRTLDDAVSMNFWWGGRLINLASLASTMFKRVRGIRQDEWAA